MKNTIERLKQLHDAVHGFDYQTREGGWSGTQRTLAEVGEDGKWKYWDMHIAFSAEACEFIAESHKIFPDLYAQLQELEAALAPFVAYAKAKLALEDSLDENWRGDQHIVVAYDDVVIRVGDLKRLVAAVEGE